MLEKKLDKVRLDNYITNLKDMKLEYIESTLSDKETNLTSNLNYKINEKIVENDDTDSSCSSPSEFNQNIKNVMSYQERIGKLDHTVSDYLNCKILPAYF